MNLNKSLIPFSCGGSISSAIKNDGTLMISPTISDINLQNVIAVSSGLKHTVALCVDGTVTTYGDNNLNQCDPICNDFKNVVTIACGDNHSVGLCGDGTVVCWGWNKYNQCDPIYKTFTNIVQVCAGLKHYSFALRADGNLLCWGEDKCKCDEITSLFCGVVYLASGHNHLVGIRNDGTVVCYPPNKNADKLTNVVSVVCGENHSVALMTDGTVACWGSNDLNQCDPVYKKLKNVVSIASGANHSVAMIYDGTVVCWGDNSKNQCSLFYKDLKDVVSIKCNCKNDTLALKKDETVVFWGECSPTGEVLFDKVSVVPNGSTFFICVSKGDVFYVNGQKVNKLLDK